MQSRLHQPLNLSTFGSSTVNSPKSYSKPPISRSFSTKGFEAGPSEIDSVLERERKAMKENQEKADTALQRQKKHRIELESRLIKAKEEISRRDKELAEVRYKLEAVLHESRNIAQENDHLRRDLESAREAYDYKMSEMHMKLTASDNNYRSAAERYTEQYEAFRQEGQDYIEVLTFQHERQRKSLEESLRRLELRNNDLTADVKRLNDQLADQQLSYEEQIRSNINRVREEEQRKYNASLLGLEQKLRTSDGIRDSLQKKNQELLRQLQDKESSLSYMGVDRSQEVASLRQEVIVLKERNSQMKLAVDRANSELAEKDQQLSRKTSTFEAEAMQLRQKLDQCRRQLDTLNDALRATKTQAREAAIASERRQQELLERCEFQESECQRYRNESANTWQHLKSKLNHTIESIHH